MSQEDKFACVVNMIREATKESNNQNLAINILISSASTGDGMGFGNVVIKNTLPSETSGECITESQVRRLHDLKDEIVRLEFCVGSKSRRFRASNVWWSLNRAMNVGSMRKIPVGKFAHAERYLESWIARLNAILK